MGTLLFISKNLKTEDFKKPWRFLILGLSIVIYFVLMFEALKTASSLSCQALLATYQRKPIGTKMARKLSLLKENSAASTPNHCFHSEMQPLLRLKSGKSPRV